MSCEESLQRRRRGKIVGRRRQLSDISIADMRSTTEPHKIRRRHDSKRRFQSQPISLSISQTTLLLAAAQAFFTCLFPLYPTVNAWSSTIRKVTPIVKASSESLPSASLRRSSLLTSLLEPAITFPSQASLSIPYSHSCHPRMALDLQMKHSIQPRSPAQPTWQELRKCGKQSTSPSTTSSVETRMTQNLNHPSMLLAGRFFPAATFVASSPVLATGVDSSRAPRTSVDNSHGPTVSVPQPVQQKRGVLGFDVFELEAVRNAGGDMEEEPPSVNPKKLRGMSSSSRLQGSRRNLDMDTWNHSGEISGQEDRKGSRTASGPTEKSFFPAPGLDWNNSPLSVSAGSLLSGSRNTFNVVYSTQGFSSPLSPVRLVQHSLPAWFPWIPTKSQIESLKVTELKEACIQRGLAKVGSCVIIGCVC
jgi:hypothetical protein